MDPPETNEGGAVHAAAGQRENSAAIASDSAVVIPPPKVAALKEEAASLAGRREGLATLPKSRSEVQLPAELHPALLLERNRRVRAEQQVEAEKQTCLELTRLLELERRKVKQQARRPSTISDSVAAARRDSGGITVSFGGKREEESLHNGESEREEGPEKKEGEDKGNTEEGEIKILSTSEDATRKENNFGHLPTQFLFNNFSSTVFQQLPRDLQEMFHVENNQEDFDAEGQPPSVLSLAYRAIRSDNPRQLRDHLAVIGEAILQSVEGAGLLGEACECGSDGCVRVLLDSGCPPNSSIRDGMSAMHLAAQNDHACCISLLLKWGADPSRTDSDSQTPLFIALCEGYRECVDILMDAGSSLQIISKMDYTMLHAAVSGNMSDVLRRLLVSLRTTLDPNSVSHVINYQDKDGNTALHLAASRGFQQCVEVMCGCPQTILTVKDRWNRTALDISTDDCRDILMSKDSKEVVVCVQARLPDTRQATPIAIGRATILRHYKCLDAELLAAQTLEQYCHSLKGHVPIPSSLESDMESSHNDTLQRSTSGGNADFSWSQPSGRHGNENHVEWAESRPPATWAERIQQDLYSKKTAGGKRSPRGSRKSTETNPHYGDLKFLWGAQQGMDRMDLGGSSIASYRVGPLSWAPGELGKQQKGKSLHTMVGDRRGGGLGWITGGKPTEIHITLKGHTEGRLDQLAFELMIPKATLHHYISMVMRDKSVVLHGPQGCGKTYLAKSIAEFLKHKLGSTTTHVLYLALHQSSRRDDLFRMLRLNGLLKSSSEHGEKDEEPLSQHNSHIVILDDLDRISGYSTPSVLGELLTMLNYRGPLNPTWLDAVHSREGNILYPAGVYFLKNSAYFIATRTQASGEALPAAVMDQFSHIPLARHSEPTSGVLYRQLVARLIHTRHGDTPHRWDKVHRCVSWVWEIWQLYNNYMKQLDLTELSLGLKHMLQCPVESGSSDNIQSWLTQLWEHHVAPRIEETLLHSRRLEGQHHQQTAHLLLRAVVDRTFRPTCPLGIGAASSLLESLYPLTPSTSSSSLPPSLSSPSFRRRHNSQGNGSPRSSLVSPVQSIGSVPDIRRGIVKSSDNGSLGSESPNMSPRTPKKVTRGDGDMDTASLDRVKLKNAGSRKNTLRRLRSRTISLFSKEGLGLGREGGGGGGFGEGGGVGEEGDTKKSGKPKETGSTLPRIFKKAKTRPALPALSEKQNSKSPKLDRAHDLEDFFDMLSTASSNRFDDQRSPAPKALSHPRTRQPNSTSAVEEPSDKNRDSLSGGLRSGSLLEDIPPSLVRSMPDLLSDDESDTHSVDRLYSTPEKSQSHSKPRSLAYASGLSPPQKAQEQHRCSSPEGPLSEPLRRRAIHRAGNIVGEELNNSSTGNSPTAGGHRASPLATTTYVYSPTVRRSIEGDEGGSEDIGKWSLNPSSTVEKEEGEKGEVAMLDRESPDGKYLTEMQVGDVGLPQRTFPDGAASRRHQRVHVSPSDPGLVPKRNHYHCESGETGEGVKEGWAEEVERRGSPAFRNPGGRHRTSSPITNTTPLGNGQLRPRRVLSEGDRCQSLEEILESEDQVRSSHILFDAGLGFLSTSPIVKGVSLPARGQSFSGGSPKLSIRKRPPISEHHEM